MAWLENVQLSAIFLHLKTVLVIAMTHFNCKSPMDIRDIHGVRTDKLPGSRVEYDPFPARFVITPGHTIFIEFKTDVQKGLIFIAGNFNVEDYIAAFLQKGRLTFERRCGNGRAYELYSRRVDDGRWHTLRYIHSAIGGKLYIDGMNPYRSYHMGPCANFNSVLFGGLASDVSMGRWSVRYVISSEELRFAGCLRNMRIDGKVPAIHPKYFAVSQCDEYN